MSLGGAGTQKKRERTERKGRRRHRLGGRLYNIRDELSLGNSDFVGNHSDKEEGEPMGPVLVITHLWEAANWKGEEDGERQENKKKGRNQVRGSRNTVK